MINKTLRSQFSVLLYFQNVDFNQELKAELFEVGYDSFAFIDQEILIARALESAPHVIIFDIDALEDPIHVFLEKVLSLNQEILFICVAKNDQARELHELYEYNLSAIVSPGENLAVRITWALDEICTGLVRLYQNEKLINDNKELESRYDRLEEHFQKVSQEKSAPPVEVSMIDRMAVYQLVDSKEDAIQAFFKSLPVKALFFKFLPTVNSFVATMAKGVDIESLKGVGCRLQPGELQNFYNMIQKGELPQSLEDLVVNGLKASVYLIRPVNVFKSLDGLVVMWGDGIQNIVTIDNLYLIFTMKYQEIHLLRRSENFDVFDPLTELHNRSFYLRKVEEEISRSKRIKKAVSVLRIKLDHFDEITQRLGISNRDLIVRTIASIIKKTSRINDISASWGEGEFGLILVHCARKGAALRAERLRRIIEGHSFAISDVRVSVSTGVSEYPTFASTAKDLDDSAAKALEFIKTRGGNKVCLYKPADSFKPDFEVEAL
jgi:diguanylate cyclase (GGDEF)-like protein